MKSSGSPAGHPPPQQQPPATRQRRHLALAGARGQVAKGRDFTRLALQDWDWDRTESAEDALLVVSELVTNANLHAGGCLQLVLTRTDVLRIEVVDGSAVPPRSDPSPRRGVPGGHGLYIIDRLCDRWGHEAHAEGKVVWAEIEGTRLISGRAAGG
ncbi:ATP-binding protein [Streptomyces sp. NPDC029216]|uniref:ATP-binding protein n=1 Tax=Streptomyces sp. NPDC029216 TaxID=3154701 RepID=UPI0033F5FAEC